MQKISEARIEIAELDAAYVDLFRPVFNRRAVCPDNGGVREADEKDVLTVGVSVQPLPRKNERAGNSTQR